MPRPLGFASHLPFRLGGRAALLAVGPQLAAGALLAAEPQPPVGPCRRLGRFRQLGRAGGRRLQPASFVLSLC